MLRESSLLRRLAGALILCYLIAAGTLPAVAGRRTLGSTLADHSLTRAHNRKVIYDPATGRWFAFWLRDTDGDPTPAPGEGIVGQSSPDGKRWTPFQTLGFYEAGSTSFDVVRSGGSLYALGLLGTSSVGTGTGDYSVRRLDIAPDGSLSVGAPVVIWASSGDPATDHFYGSLLRDSRGYFWAAARVDAIPPRAEVIRSTRPDDASAWGPGGCAGASCNAAWTDPYQGFPFEPGTVASELLDLGDRGVGLITYNKNNGLPATIGQILFAYNPTGAHDGWNGTYIELTTEANQYNGANPDDPTRLDDRRFSAVVDPRTGVIHVVYVTRDMESGGGAEARYFTLSPPYADLSDKSPELTLVPPEVDGAILSVDTRTDPSTLRLFYVQNAAPKYRLRMTTTVAGNPQPLAATTPLTGGKGEHIYPQVPVVIDTPITVMLYQKKKKDGSYDIRAKKVKLP